MKRSFYIISISALSVVILAGIWLAVRLKKEAYYESQDLKYGVKIAGPQQEIAADQARDRYIERAQLLRTKWESWALQHKDLLIRMRQAKPTDLATLDSVFQTLPGRAGDDGCPIQHEDLKLPGSLSVQDAIRLRRSLSRFAWQPYKPKPQHINDPQTRMQYEASLRAVKAKMQEDFAQYNDVVLTVSMGSGRSHIILWASGRISEETASLHNTPGLTSQKGKHITEIAPPYDFIRSGT